MEIFRVNLCFEKSEHSSQTAHDNSKVISEALQLTLVLHIFKLVLYFKSIIFINKVMYYLTVNRQNFLHISMDFIGMLCRINISYNGLLLKEHVPVIQGR